MTTTLEMVRIAFRKLKASVFFDKTMLPLRDKVVEFESNKDFNEKLKDIADAYDTGILLKNNSAYVNAVLESISTLPFPKKIDKKPYDNNCVISVGNPKDSCAVSKLQYFIDMNVQGHIFGILWILAFGRRLDECCYEQSFGNRLRSNLIWNDEGIKDSPALFEPYFGQYSLWRDKGLTCAQNTLSNKQNVLIITLDLCRFYYNAGISKEGFDKLINPEESEINKQLHSLVFAIISRYTEVLVENGVEVSSNVLPIGFLPSAILSNWCLSKFDKGILDYWNPLYYGRYVDDIIIVEKIEKESEIYEKASKASLTNDDVINYYLGTGRRDHGSPFVNTDKSSSVEFTTGVSSSKNENCVEIIYNINPVYCLSDRSNLQFECEKTRIIALFSDNNSSAILDKFKQEIFENVSEFRLMPELEDAFSRNDFNRFYHIENDATINKLRGVKNIAMDKYELSKFLGKYRVVSSLIDNSKTKEFTKIIDKMFNACELIDNYILWERLFEIFITDKNYGGFKKLVKKITKAIETISLSKSTDNAKVKESLRRHLQAALNRVMSLLLGAEAIEIVRNVERDASISLLLRENYIVTRMSNKYIITIPLSLLSVPAIKSYSLINFTDFAKAFRYTLLEESSKNEHASQSLEDKYDLLPYFDQAQDLAIAMLIKMLYGGIYSYESYTDVCKKFSNTINTFNVMGDTRGVLVEQKVKNKLNIAVANVSVSKSYNLEDVLKCKKPNRKHARYKALANVLNSAIQERADILVLPENYVPFEWLSTLATKAAKENLAIITGVEHIVLHEDDLDKRVYNFTAVILPFKFFETIPTACIFFQLKKHYSPEEKQLIEGYGYKIIEGETKRPLYCWRGCFFSVYCCYEIASIAERSNFLSWADMVVAVECNKDTNYFSNIVESLTRDLHCYCVQVNTSEYGDSRITQPTRSEKRNILSIKGGKNQTILIGEIDIKELREFQLKDYTLQKDGAFKPTPPGFSRTIVRNKQTGEVHKKLTIKKTSSP